MIFQTHITASSAQLISGSSAGLFLAGDSSGHAYWTAVPTGSYNSGSKSIIILSPVDTDNITWFYTSRSVTFKRVMYNVQGPGTLSVTACIYHSTMRQPAVGTLLSSSLLMKADNTGSGNVYVNFTNPVVPANAWVWIRVTGSITGTPTEFSVHGIFQE